MHSLHAPEPPLKWLRTLAASALLLAAAASFAAAPVPFVYSGPAVPIPDGADLSGASPGAEVKATITVSGISTPVTHVSLSIDGTACTTTVGATTVGIDHSFVNDLEITLESPAGTRVKVIDNTDGSGNNLCQVVLDDDSAGPSIQSVITANAPFTGSYTPANPLSAFIGEAANGTWHLAAQDFFSQDTGSIRAWTLNITAQDATQLTLTTSGSPAAVGTNVTFTAVVATVPLGGTPSGNVDFFADGNPLCSAVALDGSGTATCSSSALTAGNHAITASFSDPDDEFADSSVAAPLTQVIETAAAVTPSIPVPASTPALLAALGLALLALGARRARRRQNQ